MSLTAAFRDQSPQTAALVERLRARITAGPRRLAVMWGGGKDSTLALALAMAVCEGTDASVVAVTMDNPGLSPGVLDNLRRIVDRLGVAHQWWHFNERVDGPRGREADWNRLYRALAASLGSDPRFMCVACNLASVVVECAAVGENHADVLVTGNPGWENRVFATWVDELTAQFAGQLRPPVPSDPAAVRYYQFWHQIYSALLTELFPADAAAMLRQYLYPYPCSGAPVAGLTSLNVLDDGRFACTAAAHRGLLESLGWRLPDDIVGGTESDCRFTAAIAHLNIRNKGLGEHLRDIEAAHELFRPYEQMRDRAVAWSRTGRSDAEGQAQLAEMGLSDADFGHRRSGGIADALARKLFRIR